jgi:hypothetical protein
MRDFVINGTLSPKHREAGLELTEDDHLIELKYDSKTVAAFSATSVTVAEIHKEANRWLKARQT